VSLYDLWMNLEPPTALSLHLLQLVERGKDSIGQRLIGKRPESLGRLDFRRIGRQEDQMDALGKPKVSTTVPSCPIEDEHDLFVWPRSNLLSENGQRSGEYLHIHSR
jgi:hypothetical protein